MSDKYQRGNPFISLRLPRQTIEALTRAAEQCGQTRSEFARDAIEAKLAAQTTGAAKASRTARAAAPVPA